MDLNTVLVVLGALVGGTVILGVVLRRTQTRVRSVGPARPPTEGRRGSKPGGAATDSGTINPEIFAAEGEAAPQFGENLTIVQFSTETCARCPATARVLAAAASGRSGVRHVEVDVTHRDDLIRQFSILRTPTLLVLGAEGTLRTRVSGPVTAVQADDLIETHLSPAERSTP